MKRLLLPGLVMLLLGMVFPLHAQQATPSYPAPQYATEETFALIGVPRANIRSAPSEIDGRVFAIAMLGERYRILDVTEDRQWYQIAFGGSRGWVSADIILVANPDTVSPITDPDEAFQRSIDAQVAYFQNTIGARTTLSIRTGPATTFSRRGVIPAGGRVTPLGRNAYGTWFYVDYNGIQGWVSAYFLIFPPGYTFDQVPLR